MLETEGAQLVWGQRSRMLGQWVQRTLDPESQALKESLKASNSSTRFKRQLMPEKDEGTRAVLGSPPSCALGLLMSFRPLTKPVP